MLTSLALAIALVPNASAIDWSTCPASKHSLPADIDAAKAAVLSVKTPDGGTGAAIMVTPSGDALTAAHVVKGTSEVEVKTASGMILGATVTEVREDLDLAVLDVEGRGHACANPAEGEPKTGTEVFAIGSPAGEALAFSVSKGVVSGTPEIDGKTFLQTDASLNPGNSGGPIFDTNGHLLALVSWKVAGAQYEGLGFGVPVSVIREALDGGKGGVIGGTAGNQRLGKITFESPHDGVTIGYIAGQTKSTASTQYGNYSFVSTQVEDLCIAPCTKELEPKVYTFVAYGDGYEGTRLKTEVQGGDTKTFTAKPRPKALGALGRSLVYTGWVVGLTGASIWGVGAMLASEGEGDGLAKTGAQLTIGSAVVLGAGIGINIGTKGKWEQ